MHGRAMVVEHPGDGVDDPSLPRMLGPDSRRRVLASSNLPDRRRSRRALGGAGRATKNGFRRPGGVGVVPTKVHHRKAPPSPRFRLFATKVQIASHVLEIDCAPVCARYGAPPQPSQPWRGMPLFWTCERVNLSRLPRVFAGWGLDWRGDSDSTRPPCGRGSGRMRSGWRGSCSRRRIIRRP
jgi:hypothetical protein